MEKSLVFSPLGLQIVLEVQSAQYALSQTFRFISGVLWGVDLEGFCEHLVAGIHGEQALVILLKQSVDQSSSEVPSRNRTLLPSS